MVVLPSITDISVEFYELLSKKIFYLLDSAYIKWNFECKVNYTSSVETN